jgi:hypothetical protein
MDLNFELLNKALDNDNNEDILQLSNTLIKNIKTRVYLVIGIDDQNEIIKIDNKLKDYIYIDTIDKLKLGNYLRWFKNFETQLQQGGFLKEINIANEKINLVMKSITNKTFIVCFNDIVVFRKLSKEEQILLIALEVCS